MRERAISFKDPLVLAIERGEKTQTRRLVQAKPTEALKRSGVPLESAMRWGVEWRLQDERWFLLDGYNNPAYADAPYGGPGDRLWVKQRLVQDAAGMVAYGSDGSRVPTDAGGVAWPWKPATLGAMYCPRWASRLTLEVVSVRVERLQDMSDEDAIAEGIGALALDDDPEHDPVPTFARLWDSINGDRASWESNPWVWRIEFRRIDAAREAA